MVVLTCLFQIIGQEEHVFIYSLVNLVTFSLTCLFISFGYFSIKLFFSYFSEFLVNSDSICWRLYLLYFLLVCGLSFHVRLSFVVFQFYPYMWVGGWKEPNMIFAVLFPFPYFVLNAVIEFRGQERETLIWRS